ncbi:hypothetical protein D1007_62263 [Hordeum vulgare]|nr:hypothetical protein D1007_62263 [Hordeum vulgare]
MHRHVPLLVAHQLKHRHAARRRRVGGPRLALWRDVIAGTQARPHGNYAHQPAWPGAPMVESRGRVPNTNSGPPPLGTRRELLEARDFVALGRRHPASPGVLRGTRMLYRSPDYINAWRRAQFNDDHADTRPGYGGSSADHHRDRRHARDPAGSPRANIYE